MRPDVGIAMTTTGRDIDAATESTERARRARAPVPMVVPREAVDEQRNSVRRLADLDRRIVRRREIDGAARIESDETESDCSGRCNGFGREHSACSPVAFRSCVFGPRC